MAGANDLEAKKDIPELLKAQACHLDLLTTCCSLLGLPCHAVNPMFQVEKSEHRVRGLSKATEPGNFHPKTYNPRFQLCDHSSLPLGKRLTLYPAPEKAEN